METIKTINRCIIALAIMLLSFQFFSCEVFWPGSYLESLSINGLQGSLQKMIKYNGEWAISRHDIIGLVANDESLFVVQTDKILEFTQSNLNFVKAYTYNAGAKLNSQNINTVGQHYGSISGNDYDAVNLTKFTDGSICLSPIQATTQAPYYVYSYNGDPTGEQITTLAKYYSIVLKSDGTGDVIDQGANRIFDQDQFSYIDYTTNGLTLSGYSYNFYSPGSMRITPVINSTSDSIITGLNSRPYSNSNVALILNRHPISSLRTLTYNETDLPYTPIPLGYNNINYSTTIKGAVGIAGSAIWDSNAASFFDTASNYVGTCQLVSDSGNGIALQGCAVGKDSLFVIIANNDPSGTTSVDNRNNGIYIYKYNWSKK